MNCDRAQAMLSEYLDGELSAGRTVQLEQHLSGCELCGRELAALRRAVQAVRELPRYAAPAGMLPRVMASVREEPETGEQPRTRIISLWPRAAADHFQGPEKELISTSLLLAHAMLLKVWRRMNRREVTKWNIRLSIPSRHCRSMPG